MEFPKTIQEAISIGQRYFAEHGDALEPATRDLLLAAVVIGSEVQRLCAMAETLYAARDELNDQGKIAVAQMMNFAGRWDFNGLSIDNRAGRIIQAMRRDMGEEAPAGLPWPEPETDPAPLASSTPVVTINPVPVP